MQYNNVQEGAYLYASKHIGEILESDLEPQRQYKPNLLLRNNRRGIYL